MTILTAKQARENVLKSKQYIQKILDRLSVKIEKESKLGNSFLQPAWPYEDKFFEVKIDGTHRVLLNEEQERVIKELKELGYVVEIERKEVEIKRFSCDEPQRYEQKYLFTIRW